MEVGALARMIFGDSGFLTVFRSIARALGPGFDLSDGCTWEVATGRVGREATLEGRSTFAECGGKLEDLHV